MARDIWVQLDKNSEREVINSINSLLTNTRKQAPVIVKQLSRMAANSAANLTIPNSRLSATKAIGSITGSGKSSVRRPTSADKFRPLVNASEQSHGNFYVVNKAQNSGKRKNKRGRRQMGMMGTKGESRVMRGSRGELVIMTTKKISQKDRRFQRIKKLIKAWDKKAGRYRYIPTTTRGKWEKGTKAGKIPFYFAAKQAWLWSQTSFSASIVKLNGESRLRSISSSRANLSSPDSPSVTMGNNSRYAHKRGGTTVPTRALAKAYRGYLHMLHKQRDKIVEQARRA